MHIDNRARQSRQQYTWLNSTFTSTTQPHHTTTANRCCSSTPSNIFSIIIEMVLLHSYKYNVIRKFWSMELKCAVLRMLHCYVCTHRSHLNRHRAVSWGAQTHFCGGWVRWRTFIMLWTWYILRRFVFRQRQSANGRCRREEKKKEEEKSASNCQMRRLTSPFSIVRIAHESKWLLPMKMGTFQKGAVLARLECVAWTFAIIRIWARHFFCIRLWTKPAARKRRAAKSRTNKHRHTHRERKNW